jgi:hypothetical protein
VTDYDEFASPNHGSAYPQVEGGTLGLNHGTVRESLLAKARLVKAGSDGRKACRRHAAGGYRVCHRDIRDNEEAFTKLL